MLRHSQMLDKLAKYLMAAVLVIVPLYPKFPFINIPGTYVAIRFEDFLLFTLAIVTFSKILLSLGKFIKDPIIRAFLIYFGIGLVSVISGAFLTKTISPSLGFLHLIRRIEYVIPLFAALTFFRSENIKEYLQFFLKILVIVGIVAFVYGLGQRYFHLPVIITQNQEYSRGMALTWIPGSHINSTFAGHYDLAAFEVITLPILIACLLLFKDAFSKIALLAASFGGLWLMVNSISRIAQVSYLLSLGVTLILIKKYKELAIIVLISLLVIGTSSGLGTRFRNIFRVIVRAQEDVMVIATPTPVPVIEDRSTSIRLKVEWPRAVRALNKNPILGTGYSSITLATDNDYLRVLGETGILGFLAFSLIFYRIGRLFFSALPLTKYFEGIELGFVAGIFGALGGTLLTATFIDIFEASKFAIIFWFFIGIAIFMVRNVKNVQKN